MRPAIRRLFRGPDPPPILDRFLVGCLVLLPWLAVYQGVQWLGPPPGAFSLDLPFERAWPVWEWTEALYASSYLVLPLTPLLLGRRAALRAFAVQGLAATVAVGTLWLAVPVVAAPRPFTAHTVLGALLLWERSTSCHVAAFPSFHVLWAFIAADALGRRSRAVRLTAWAWALLVSASCATTGQHALADILAGAAVFLPLQALARRREDRVRALAQRRGGGASVEAQAEATSA